MANSALGDGMPITVNFNRGLRTDGELISVTIRQGADEIKLTHEQTRSLVMTLTARCSL